MALSNSAKVGVGFVLLHCAAFAFSWIVRPEYDDGDFAAFIFLIAISHIFLIAGGLILLFNLLRWFVRRTGNPW